MPPCLVPIPAFILRAFATLVTPKDSYVSGVASVNVIITGNRVDHQILNDPLQRERYLSGLDQGLSLAVLYRDVQPMRAAGDVGQLGGDLGALQVEHAFQPPAAADQGHGELASHLTFGVQGIVDVRPGLAAQVVDADRLEIERASRKERV